MSKVKNPNDLIRIEDAIMVLCRIACHPGAFCPDGYCVEMWEEFENIKRVDAVPVVRCKDCKWYQPDADKWCGYFECMGFEPDDYCSQGERKDGDDEKAD